MGKMKDALIKLAKKLTGKEPQGDSISNVIDSIANDYKAVRAVDGLTNAFEVGNNIVGKHFNVDNVIAFIQPYTANYYTIANLFEIEEHFIVNIDTHEETLDGYIVRVAGEELSLDLDTDLLTTLSTNKEEIENVIITQANVDFALGVGAPIYLTFGYDVKQDDDGSLSYNVKMNNDDFYNLFEEAEE